MAGIHEAIVNVMRDMEAVGKDHRNEQQRYQFRGIDDVYNALHPLLKKHGVFMTPKILETQREIRATKSGGEAMWSVVKVQYTLHAIDGSSVVAETMGEAMDTGDKSLGKAQSYAHKVALIQTFAIPTEDDNDTENHSHELSRNSDQRPQQRQQQRPPQQSEERPSHPTATPAAAEVAFIAGMSGAKSRDDLKAYAAAAKILEWETACPGAKQRVGLAYEAHWRALNQPAQPTPAQQQPASAPRNGTPRQPAAARPRPNTDALPA